MKKNNMKSIHPMNFIENKIKLLLCISGYKQREIEFKSHMGGDERILRIGYWQMLDDDIVCNIQENINVILKPITFWEDDCGWLTWYNIIITERKQK